MTALKLGTGLTDAVIDQATIALGNNTADMRALAKRMRNADLWVAEIALGQAALASAGKVAIFTPANATQTIKIREIVLSGAGTAFSGGGGDRLISVTDGTSTWTAITAALLGTPVATRWGGSGVPFPATAAHHVAASVVGTPAAPTVYAQYSGGSADYTAGALTLLVTYEITTE